MTPSKMRRGSSSCGAFSAHCTLTALRTATSASPFSGGRCRSGSGLSQTEIRRCRCGASTQAAPCRQTLLSVGVGGTTRSASFLLAMLRLESPRPLAPNQMCRCGV